MGADMASTLWRGLALALFLAATPAAAQDTPETLTPPGAPEASAATAAPAPAAAPATTGKPDFSQLTDIDSIVHIPDAAVAQPGKPLDVEAATQAYLDEIPSDARARSDAYFEGGYLLIVVDFIYALVVAGILMFGRLSANFRDRAQRITRFKWLQSAIYGIQYFVVAGILTLPINIYEGWYREQQYGMSNQTLPEWFKDYGIVTAFGLISFMIAIVVVYAIIRWTKSRWWIWATAFSIAFFAVQAFLFPVFLAPALNDYKPLAEGPVKASILSMARANGVPATDVFEFDASRQTKRMSANVSGFGDTTRVSLNDNLMRRGTPAEVRAVMGHELGHYVLRHNWLLLTDLALLLLIAFGFTNWAYNALVTRFGNTWRVSGIDDPAGLPVLFALLAFLGFVGTPVLNTVVRNGEYQADIFGLNAAREPDGFAVSALKLGEYRKLDPQPWEEVIFYDHPSGRSRIHMAMQWKAEHPGEGTYDHRATR